MRSRKKRTEKQTPLHVVLFGATGDLANRKLIPALLDLYIKGKLPKRFCITGIARSPRSNKEYREFIQNSIVSHGHMHSSKDIADFCKHCTYVSGEANTRETYTKIKNAITTSSKQAGTTPQVLFYLAIPPSLYETVFVELHASKLQRLQTKSGHLPRVLVEKPFGSDLKSAQQLDRKLGRLFKEEQIYRIDHYLAKEAVQNLLSFRFANRLFAQAWSNEHIERITITMHETVTAEKRAGFYDSIGALRDVGQNHLLQLVALLTMKEPTSFTADDIRQKRLEALEQLRPFTKKTIAANFTRAQYTGYKQYPGVAKGSKTETFFEIRTELTDRRWRGVPIYIRAGKGLHEARVAVHIDFKDVTQGLFVTESCKTTENALSIMISPEQRIIVSLNAKMPGLGYQLETRELAFTCAPEAGEIKNSYEKVLLDCIVGDQTLFTTTKEVMTQWRFIESILAHIESVPLHTYKKGSRGPKTSIVPNPNFL